jgi:IclR family acetate operon transcriptional repressor
MPPGTAVLRKPTNRKQGKAMKRNHSDDQGTHGRARDKAPSDRGSVQSLIRALSLLEILAEDDEGYRLVDLALRTGLSTSTAHRLLTTLEQKRFVQFDHQTSLWHVGAQCFSVGTAFGRRRNLGEMAHAAMRQVRDATGETVNLGLADQGTVLFVSQVESREQIRAISRPGGHAPLVCTALGQAILSGMKEGEVGEIVQKHGLPRLTPNSIARPSELYKVLEEVRRVGFAVDDEQNSLGLRCVAATIYNEVSMPMAAVSIAGPTLRVTLQRIPELGQQVMAAAREITRAIGGRLPATPLSNASVKRSLTLLSRG